MHCGFKAVSAIVACAAGNPNALRMRRNGHGQLCAGQTGALHQGVRGQCALGLLFKASCGGDIVQGPSIDAMLPRVVNAMHKLGCRGGVTHVQELKS